MKLGELGEFGLISRIDAASSRGIGVLTGIGDDSSVTALTPGMQLLTSADMLLEDVHFRRDWHDPYRLGRKSLAVNISDIAAMGGIPRWALLCLAAPAEISLDYIDEFTRGFLDSAAEHGVSLVGGDTCASERGFIISVTIMGEQFPDLVLRRSGAMPDDDIWVTGTLGDAALGLKMLESASSHADGKSGGDSERDFLISRLLNPTPRVAAGLALAESGLVSAMIDISDGLLADFGHIADQSGVGGLIRIDSLPLSAAHLSIAPSLTGDTNILALSGGEDYELCFTAPPTNREKIADCLKKCGIEARPVGIVTKLPGVAPVHDDGTACDIQTDGFRHFTCQ